MLQILILITFHSFFNHGKMEIIYMTICNQKWGPTSCCSKASKEARLVEGKGCLILDVEEDSCPKTSSPPRQSGNKSFYRQGRRPPAERAPSAPTVISKQVMRWQINAILTVLSTVSLHSWIGLLPFLETTSWNCGSLCPG